MYLDTHGLGTSLKSIRNELNMTIEEASFLAGISEKTIYRIEHGMNQISMSTLDKLSLAYKKDLFIIYNKYISNPQEKLFNLIDRSERSLYIDDLKTIKSCTNELKKISLKQFTLYKKMYVKHYIKLLESAYIDIKYGDRIKAINLLIDSIKSEIYDFQISNYKNFNYSPIEKRILMNVSIMSYEPYRNEVFLNLLSYLSSSSNNDNIVYPKVVTNLATLYHQRGDYQKSLNIINEGINYCIRNRNFNILSKLFFRKFTSEVNLNMKNDYKETLKKTIFMTELNNQEYLKNIFIINAKKIYGVDIETI